MTMKKLKAKLKSNAGASMALALVLLMITTVLTAVAVSSAVTTAKRGKSRQETQQTILSLQSALVLMRDEFTGSTAKVEETFRKTDGSAISIKKEVVFSGSLSSLAADNPLRLAIQNAILQAYAGLSHEFVSTVGATVGSETLESVAVKVSMERNGHSNEDNVQDYQVTISCSSADAKELLSVDLDSSVKKETKEESNGYKIVTTIEWTPGGGD